MKDTIKWLIGIEALAADVYERGALCLKKEPEFADFCEHLSADERVHYDLMKVALGVEEVRAKRPAIAFIGDDAKLEIENTFLRYGMKIDNGDFTKDDLLDLIISVEFSEWNDIFLYVCNTLKHGYREFVPVVTRIQGHKRHIQRFIESQPGYEAQLEMIKQLPAIWEEKLLVVDSDNIISDLLTAILEGEGIVKSATGGEEGLRMLNSGYYTAIVADFELPNMNGKEFYLEATKRYENINERIVFFTDMVSEECKDFFSEHDARFILKPSPIGDVKSAVVDILCK